MKKVIHQGFDFAQLGGFPLNQQRLEWMQTAYAELSGGLAAMFGDNVIVSGCIVSGQSVSDGWIVVNGELLPFLGSQTGVLDTFLIRTDLTPLTFKDASSKSVQFRKYAQFGTSSDAIAWNTLKRMASYTDISAHLSRKDNPHSVTKSQVGLGNLPNAKTDDPAVSDSNILATSAMVSAISGRIFARGSVTLKTSESSVSIKLSDSEIPDSVNWIVIARIYTEFININRDRTAELLGEYTGISLLNNKTNLNVSYDNTKMTTGIAHRLNYIIIKTS